MREQIKDYKYCNSLTQFSRLKTCVVNIGEIPLGGDYSIRIQSMTNTNTLDTKATVNQIIRIINSGADYVRITIPKIKDAENLINIKSELCKQGYTTPLIADIHFNPQVAEIAAKVVEKVRINPGNYVDRKKNQKSEYTDIEYKAEIEKIRLRFVPLIKICKEHRTAMRIGVNHGSLSERILTRYGDTPLGMVESAMEFLLICAEEDYNDVVLSMKASNTKIMVQAYRLLINKMQKQGMKYPLHLGVTEAGEGQEGRIKSAVGIGTLLADGIGDTIRVSLTEEPEKEVPVAKALVNYFANRNNHQPIKPVSKISINPYAYQKRETVSVNNIGGKNIPVVIADLSLKKNVTCSILKGIGYNYSKNLNKWELSELPVEYIYVGDNNIQPLPNPPQRGGLLNLGIICNYSLWKEIYLNANNYYPLFTIEEYLKSKNRSSKLNFISIKYKQLSPDIINTVCKDNTVVFVVQTGNINGVAEQRALFYELMNNNCRTPVIIQRSYKEKAPEELQIKSACDIGALLIDGFGDGIWLKNEINFKSFSQRRKVRQDGKNKINFEDINRTAFSILQAGRVRTSKTEYISCPSCGRTLFDLQKTTAAIRKRTSHLKTLKIAIMGCIVNGPGEMADADYGYVGSGEGKITLYKAQEIIKRNIFSKNAVDELINLIKEQGDWIDL